MSSILGDLTDKAKAGFMAIASGIGDSLPTPKHYRRVAGVVVYADTFDGIRFLLVKKPRTHHAWQFPQGGADKRETLYSAAKRELKEELGDVDIAIKNKKVGSYKYAFPKNFVKKHQAKAHGAQVSFFVGEWVDGEIILDPQELTDFAWVRYDEIAQMVAPEYAKVVLPICQKL
jgi:8-oxo-dGTP pyrophosphatase MutT (NUDIX family)